MFIEIFNPQAKINKTNEEWKNVLEPEVFVIAREHGTEKPFSGEHCGLHKDGDYYCKVCSQYLFDSASKFDSGTGWPSYYQAVNQFSLTEKTDDTYGMRRTEILCGRCGSHLGHVFNDGPKPTGLRYCMNSRVLQFVQTNQNLDLLIQVLQKSEIEVLQQNQLYDKLNQILNQLNKSELSLENIIEKIKEIKAQNCDKAELLNVLGKF